MRPYTHIYFSTTKEKNRTVQLECGIKKMDGRPAGVCFLLALLLLGSPIYAGMIFFSLYTIAIGIL
jgi:hypothetical protein